MRLFILALLFVISTGQTALARPATGTLLYYGNPLCGATLITPTLALTAAHCLTRLSSGGKIDPARLRFVLPDGESYAVHRTARLQSYRAQEHDGLKRAAEDLGLVELSQSVAPGSWDPVPIARGGYRQSEVYVPGPDATLQPCAVMLRRGDVLIISCTVDFGASGSAVLIRGQAGLEQVAVLVAKAEAGDDPIALAAYVGGRFEDLEEILRAQP